MRYRDVFWACLEMSTVDQHEKTIFEQFTMPGEKSKVVALARCMPKALISRLVETRKVDRLPLHSDATISDKPLGYGGESLVYDLKACDSNNVFKIEHSKFPIDKQLEQFTSNLATYRHYFDDLVVPTNFLICESPYGSGAPVIASVQPKIDGVPILEAEDVRQVELEQLLSGAARMIDEQGMAPDFGLTNMLVDDAGHISIIDTGYLIPVKELDPNEYSQTIGYLESLRQPELHLAS